MIDIIDDHIAIETSNNAFFFGEVEERPTKFMRYYVCTCPIGIGLRGIKA
jgi:hypothetical protein